MKQILLIIFICASSVLARAQSPRIAVDTSTLTATAPVGGTATVTLSIKNSGNRDLHWSLPFTSVSGRPVTFSKADYADWTLPANQDRISDKVWITREDEEGLFNIKLESGFSSNSSPAGTKWAYGNSLDLQPTDYQVWRTAVRSNGRSTPDQVNETISLQLTDENRYFDFDYSSWTVEYGGGFSYTRREIFFGASYSQDSGRLKPGESAAVTVNLNAAKLSVGIYSGFLTVQSDDPVSKDLLIPVELTVTGGAPEVDAAASLDFGSYSVMYSKTDSIAIKNTGTGILTVSNISSDNSAFTPLATNFTVLPGKTYYLKVSYLPGQVQAYAGNLSLVTNDSDESSLSVSLSGLGIAAPRINVTYPPLTFNLQTGQTSTAVINIANTGGSDLIFSLKKLLGESAAVAFEKPAFADYTLFPNQDIISPEIRITRQNIQGIYNTNQETSYLHGSSPVGTSWALGKTADLQPVNYKEWRTALNTGPLGQINNPISLHLINEDRYFDVNFSKWSQSQGGGFAYTRKEVYNWLSYSSSTGTLAPGDNSDITITFHPANLPAGTYSGFIEVASNVPEGIATRIPVTLNIAGSPRILSGASSFDLGSSNIRKPISKKLHLLNNGTETLTISSVSSDNPAFSVQSAAISLAPLQVMEVEIIFTPDAVQSYSGNLTVVSNDPLTPSLLIPLRGQGLGAAGIDITSDVLAATVNTGTTVTKRVTISNNGQGTLNFTIATNGLEAPVTFTKKTGSDPGLEENQDRISDDVWITRAGEGIFNIQKERGFEYYNNSSPAGTEWQMLPTAVAPVNNYRDWFNAISHDFTFITQKLFSMRTVGDDQFYDIKFNAFSKDSISYTRIAVPGWVKADALTGSILPSESRVITLTYDPRQYLSGTYNANLVVSSNADPSNINLPLALTVVGAPEIEVLPTALDYGDVYLGHPKTMALEIFNKGTESLNITGIASSSAAFTTDVNSLVIPPFKSAKLNVALNPGTTQTYNETLTFSSDDSDESSIIIPLSGSGFETPGIAVTPDSIHLKLFPGETKVIPVTITNTKAGILKWRVPTLETTLQNLNSKYSELAALIPNRFNFRSDGGTDYISDGGADMYDGGNYLSTNLGGSVPYSDNLITDGSAYFGIGTKYFTRHLPGLFVLGTDLKDISTFNITGNNGADGVGNVDAVILETVVNGRTYQGFVKRVFNAGDPSINHLIIVEKNPAASQTSSSDTGNDEHTVSGLNSTGSLYYLLYSSSNGGYIDDTATRNIMNKFLEINEEWLVLSAESGEVSASATETVHATIDLTGLAPGNYSTLIELQTNDPARPLIQIPVKVEYGNLLVIKPVKDSVVNEGFTTAEIDLLTAFSVQSGNLTFNAYSDNVAVVTPAITGTTLQLTEAGTGKSLITLRAEDENGNVLYDDFIFRVNDIPDVNPIADQHERFGFGSKIISLAGVFLDSDSSDILSYSATSSNPAVAGVSINGTDLAITENGSGTTTITVKVDDGFGGIAENSFTLTVSKRIQTITFDAIPVKTYGNAPFNLGSAVSSAGLTVLYTAADPAIVSISGNTATILKAGITEISASQAGNANYNASTASQTLTVNRKDLLISADSKTKFAGTANPEFTFSYTGFANNESQAALSQLPLAATTATLSSPIGDYPITVSGAAADSYSITYQDNILKVLPGAPTSVALAAAALFENSPAGTTAGTLNSTSDDPNAAFTYTLVNGSGDTDNNLFSISGASLKTTASLNFEQKSRYSVRVSSTTQYGFSLEQVIMISLTDVNEMPTLDAIANQLICYTTVPQNIRLTGMSAGPEGSSQSVGLTVSSSNANLFDQLSVSNDGVLSYRVKQGMSGEAIVTVTVKDNGGTANGGADTFGRNFSITVNLPFAASIVSDKGQSISKGTTVKLTASGGNTYSWNNPGGVLSGQSSATLTIRPSATATYRVTVTSASGCVSEQEIRIEVKEDFQTIEPANILTPNGDGLNDFWVVKNLDMYPNNEVKVFDRAGRLLYSKKKYDNSWNATLNGNPLAEGTYFYIIDFGDGKLKKKGYITVVKRE